MEPFRALVVEKTDDDTRLVLRQWDLDDLMPGEVTIRVRYSSVNYKDALAAEAKGGVARAWPLIPGIDLAGTVVQSLDPRYVPTDEVIVHGYGLGVSQHGGFAELARVPAGWVVPLPEGLTPRQAMALGTAGFTAGMAVVSLERMGVETESGPVIVTGASGGVGSVAVDLLATRGYTVLASTGSPDSEQLLRTLGAAEILDRRETQAPGPKPLDRARWAGAVDTVGGQTLAYLLQTLQTDGSVAVCGNTGGVQFQSSVLPFILRGVSALGMDSVNMALDRRIALWNRLGGNLKPTHLDDVLTHEVALDEVPDALAAIRKGQLQGRTVVRVTG